jgi:DNA mismatch endonuclease, patch repair protein
MLQRWDNRCMGTRFTKRAVHPCTCQRCSGNFKGRDYKSALCDACSKVGCADCGSKLSRPTLLRGRLYCLPCQRKRPSVAQVASWEHMWEATRADNPMNNPVTREKARQGLIKNHPARLYPEQWAEHASHMRSKRGTKSKLEDAVALWLPSADRQYKIAHYHVDFAYPEHMLVVEAHGCFWHACAKCYPAGAMYPSQKQSVANDVRKRVLLEAAGWRVVVVWECAFYSDPSDALEMVTV